MLNATKKDLISQARQLTMPYESYTIDELANAYCDAIDNKNEILKNIYISALILRFWYKIDKLYKSNTVAPCLDRTDFFWVVYEAIEYACKYRGWKNPEKKLNAQQCINKCINTIMLQKYYDLRLDKNKAVNFCCSLDTPVCGDSEDKVKTLADILESNDTIENTSNLSTIMLIQNYINRNKIIEAILLDNIAFNDVQRTSKRQIKTTRVDGTPYKYTEHYSEFWPYRLVQLVSKLPNTYKDSFLARYDISEEKLTAVLDVIDRSTNQKLYRYLRQTLSELKMTLAQFLKAVLITGILSYYIVDWNLEEFILYLDLFDELRLNKRLVKFAGFETAAYWAELQSILKQVVKKQTADERGFFLLDRAYVERETTLTVAKQLKCEEKLVAMGVALKDPDNPNKLAISVANMIEIITNEDTSKLKKTNAVKQDAKEAKIAGIKATMKRAIFTADPELRNAYERWIEGMIDAANCRFTKAVVQLFEKTVSQYTPDKQTQLKIIEIATINSYRDATWAINKICSPTKFTHTATKLPEQKICTGVATETF